MSTLAANVRERATLRVLASADTIALGVLTVVAVATTAVTWGTWGDLDSDTGYDVVAGLRIADGDLPYADFTYFYGPLSAFVAGLTALVGGGGFGAAAIVGMLITGAILGATYALARTQVGPLGALLASLIALAVAFVPSNYSYVLPHTSAATLGTLGLLVLLLCLYRWRITADGGWLVCAGAVLGLLTLTKPEPALAALVAAAVWIGVEERGARIRAALRIAAPALAIPLVAYGLLSLAASPQDILFENLWPREVLAAGGNTLLDARMPLTPSSAVWLAGMLAAYAAGTAALVLLARRVDVPLAAALALGIGVAAVAAAADADKLREATKYAWAWVPAGAIIAVVVLARRRRAGGASDASAAIALPAAAALAVVAFTTYRGFYLHATRPQMAVFYAPLAAILVARVHLVDLARGSRQAVALGALWVAFLGVAGLGLTLQDARAESATVSGAGGSLSETPAEAALYQEALTWMERTRPGERILVAPLLTGLYALSERESPLRELSLLPSGLPDEAAQAAAIERLKSSDVGMIVIDNREWPAYGHGRFGETFDQTLAAWIADGFERRATLRTGGAQPRTLDVWIKRRPQ